MDAWMAFVSIIAIVAIVLVGGLIIAFIGHVIIGAFDFDSKGTTKSNDSCVNYEQYKQMEQNKTSTLENKPEYNFSEINKAKAEDEKRKAEADKKDYDVFKIDDDDEDLKELEAKLAKQSAEKKSAPAVKAQEVKKPVPVFEEDEDDDDLDDLLSEISDDVIDKKKSQDKPSKQTSILDKYNIDDYVDDDELDEEELDRKFVEESQKENEELIEKNRQLDEAKQQIEELQAQMAELNAQLESEEEDKTEQDKLHQEELEASNQEIEELKAEMEKLNEQLTIAKEAKVTGDNQNIKLLGEAQRQIEYLKYEMVDLTDKLASTEDEKSQNEKRHEEEMQETKNQIEELKNLMLNINSQLSSMEEQRVSAEKERKEAEEKAQQLAVEKEQKMEVVATDARDTVAEQEDVVVERPALIDARYDDDDDDNGSKLIDDEMFDEDDEEETSVEPNDAELKDAKQQIEELKAQIALLNTQIETKQVDGKIEVVTIDMTEEECLQRLEILEERLRNVKKDYKINLKEYRPLKKVMNDLEKNQTKLRRREAVVAKKKVALYGVNNYVDIDKEKAEKLANELELLDGLRLSVNHCEEVINANKDRFPILEHTNKILEDQIENLEADIASTQLMLERIREKNGEGNK